jgi:rhodanese-related sulfurtransferase
MLGVIFLSSSVFAEIVTEKQVPKGKVTKAGLYVTAKNAYDALKQQGNKILFLDVRTRGEVVYVGMPTVADANVPLKFTSKKYQWNDKKNTFKMTPNPDFVDDAMQRLQEKGLTKDDIVFVMCRSGGRSAKAADKLTEAGFTRVYSVIDGFEGDTVKSGENKGKRAINGWKNSNLPWSYSLDKNKMYFKLKDKKGHLSKMLKKMDSDKDNKVTQSEFDAFHQKMFASIDKNKDGIIDEQELKAHKMEKKKKGKM